MKKLLYIVLAIVGVSVFLYFSVTIRTNTGCPPPNKPSKVPESAVWKGGCDGGSWIELVSIAKEKVRFRIYQDWNGDLILDAVFEYKDCGTFRLTESSWKKCAGDFINGNIGIHIDCNKDTKCRLEPIYPAHYEESLD